MKITDIRKQKNNPDKCNIYIDGEYKLSLSVDYILNNNIKVNQEVTEEELTSFKEHDKENIAFLTAINYLSYSQRSEKEVYNKLKSKEFSEEEIAFVIEKLKKYSYIDDYAYTASYIKDKMNYSGWGEMKIKEKLYHKGIPAELINELINEIYSEEEMLKNALILGQKKLLNLQRFEPQKQKEKIYTFLMSKGFKYNITKQVIERIFSDIDED